MNSFVLALASVLACASAGVLVPIHGQDLMGGGYAYGYVAAPGIETKTELRQLGGGYKYLDGFGQMHVEYKPDPKIGFIAANLQDTPEVALAKKEHFKAVELAKLQQAQHLVIPQVGYTGYVQPVIAKTTVDIIPTKDSLLMMEEMKKKDTMQVDKAKEEHLKAVEKELQLQKEQEKILTMKEKAVYTPQIYTHALIKPDIYALKSEPILPVPVVKTEPIVPELISHQYHSQDELGRFAYSYDDVNSAKVEAGVAGKDVAGQYSYVDANSKLQTVRYIADDKGFRVAATNLPVHDVLSGDARYQMAFI